MVEGARRLRPEGRRRAAQRRLDRELRGLAVARPTARKSICLPGKYNVSLKVASGTAQNREFELVAGGGWGLLAGPAGIPLPLHLY